MFPESFRLPCFLDVPEELSIIEKTAEEVPDLHSAESIASTTDSTSKEETSLDESESVNTLPSVLVEIATSTESIISETELQSDQATTAEQTAIEKATDAVDTPEQVRVQLPIWKIIANNSASEKATIKGKEIAKTNTTLFFMFSSFNKEYINFV